MFSSIVKAGMRAITPREKTEAKGNATVNVDNGSSSYTCGPYPTTPNARLSQASVATPSTASMVDIAANSTTLGESSVPLDTGKDYSEISVWSQLIANSIMAMVSAILVAALLSPLLIPSN